MSALLQQQQDEAMMQPESVDTLRQLRAAGTTWAEITRLTGLTYWVARSRIYPELAEAARVRERKKWANKPKPPRKTTNHVADNGHMSPVEIKRVLSTVPPDTRRLVSRLFGDPLPGRSALDKRQQAARVSPTIHNPYTIRAEHWR